MAENVEVTIHDKGSVLEPVPEISESSEGWIWKARRRPGNWGLEEAPFGDEEGEDAWQEESDRVHWFRSEAEFFRWLEQTERKHFEFLRVIRSFKWNSSLWCSRAEACGWKTGLGAFASRQVGVYSSLHSDALALFRKCAVPDIVPVDVNVDELSHEDLVRTCSLHRTSLINSARSLHTLHEDL